MLPKEYGLGIHQEVFFEIPLLDMGGTNHFNPDFIVWADNAIVAIDTKGDHLIVGDAGRKLLDLKNMGMVQT